MDSVNSWDATPRNEVISDMSSDRPASFDQFGGLDGTLSSRGARLASTQPPSEPTIKAATTPRAPPVPQPSRRVEAMASPPPQALKRPQTKQVVRVVTLMRPLSHRGIFVSEVRESGAVVSTASAGF